MTNISFEGIDGFPERTSPELPLPHSNSILEKTNFEEEIKRETTKDEKCKGSFWMELKEYKEQEKKRRSLGKSLLDIKTCP